MGWGPGSCVQWPLSVPTDMSSGQVALYMLALRSSCCDPRDVAAHGQSVDLLSILQEKTDQELTHLGMGLRVAHGNAGMLLWSVLAEGTL